MLQIAMSDEEMELEDEEGRFIRVSERDDLEKLVYAVTEFTRRMDMPSSGESA